MATTYPGTTIEASKISKDSSKALFDGIFATGGITLSQVSVMTGLEPYIMQNWVKRGFLSSPKKRVYSREQFARIVIINMLRETLQIERICNLIYFISGEPDDPTDELISNDELYHRYVNMISGEHINPSDDLSVIKAAEKAADGFEERFPNAKQRVIKILQVMYYAHSAANLRKVSDEILSTLN
jgi:hypothetical protein